MVKWWYGKGLANSHEGQSRQQQQQQHETATGMKSVHPPSYESVTHQVNAAGGIQINHTENGTQIVTGIRHTYAESVPESSVTEDFEKDDAATEDSGWETEDTDDAVSRQKKFASLTSSESTSPRPKTSAGIQNNNMGNGTQVNTFSSQGNWYTIHSGTGSQFYEANFYGNVDFRIHDRIRDTRGKQDNDASSEPYTGTRNIHVQYPNRGTDVRISASGIYVKEKDGREFHIPKRTGNNIRGSTRTSGVIVHASPSQSDCTYGGRETNSSYNIYNTGSGGQINGPVYGNIY